MADERARNLRKNPTEAEKRLWRYLRSLKGEGFHFRRQVPLGRYIVDLCCHSAKLVIEADGGQHADEQAYDAERTAWLQSQGYRVLRFWNNEIFENIDGVTQTVLAALKSTPTPTPPHKGEGLKIESQ